MVLNCSITSWKHVAGVKGDLVPVLGSELVPSPSRALPGELIEPSSHAVQSAADRSIKLDRTLRLRSRMLTHRSIVPEEGDRLTVKFFRPGGYETLRFEISGQKPDAANGVAGAIDVTTIFLARVEDGV